MAAHKNKTFASTLAFFTGGFGLHRFYLRGMGDKWGWLHLLSLPASGIILSLAPGVSSLFAFGPFVLSVLIAFLETLVLGLMPDEKWDARFNAGSGRTSDSGWPLAVLLVLTVGVSATALIGVIARSFDLLLTGGAYG